MVICGSAGNYLTSLALNFTIYLGRNVITCEDPDELPTFLTLSQVDSLFIYSDGPKEIFELSEYYIEKTRFKGQVVFHGDPKHYRGKHRFFEDGLGLKGLIQKMARCLAVTPSTLINAQSSHFFSIPIRYFFYLTHSSFSIYSGDNFKQVIQKGGPFDIKKIKELQKLGYTQLYIESNERAAFANLLTAKIMAVQHPSDPFYDDQTDLKGARERFQVLSELILGSRGELSAELANMVNADAIKFQKIVGHHATLNQFLKNLINQKNSFRFQESMLINLFSDRILKSVDWGTREHREKLNFCSYFHDLLLPNDQLAKINSVEELEYSGLSEKAKNRVRGHAHDISKVVSKLPQTPQGVDQILREHHSKEDGQGFSNDRSRTSSQLVKVFLVSKDFARNILLGPENVNYQSAFDRTSGYYPKDRKLLDPVAELL